MHAVTKRRTPVRSSFTRNYDALMHELYNENPDEKIVRTKFATLERLYSELNNLDEQMSTLTLEDDEGSAEDYVKEYETVERYREKMDHARVETEQFFERNARTANIEQHSNASSICLKRKLKLPKIELKKFSGEIKDFLNFWSQFKRIHEDEDMDKEDKFQYLIQSTVEDSRARELVESFPATAENYEKAIDSLRNRFGREELLIEYYVRELLSLVIKNATLSTRRRDIARLYDSLESHLRALESISVTSDKYAAMLFPLVESCVPEDVLRIWLRGPASASSEHGNELHGDRLKNLMLFLRKEVEGEERISLAKAGFKLTEDSSRKEKSKRQPEESVPTAMELFAAERKKQVCLFCESAHESKECFHAQKLSFAQKQDILKKKKACFICLKQGHRAKDCKKKISCIVCSKRHCTLMCNQLEAKQKNEIDEERAGENRNAALSNQCSSEIFLQTLLVTLEENGKKRTIRALIDTGSQRSYILKRTAKEMGFQPVGSEVVIHTLFGGGSTKKIEHQCYNICLTSLTNDFACRISVLDQPMICGPISRLKPSIFTEEIRKKGISLADVGAGQPVIELLIGADALGKLYTGVVEELDCGLIATKTRLGWTVMGKMEDMTKPNSHATAMVALLTHTSHLPDLWKLDALGISDPSERKSNEEIEIAVMEHFKRTVKKNTEGRYKVKLPWLDNREKLSDNRTTAEKRLISTTYKLNAVERFRDYDDVLQSWLVEGIIEEVPDGEVARDAHYLPHRAVFKDNSTTRVRPVFDASCKSKGSYSLNDCLAKGPNLIDLIPKILLTFREKRIGVTADIKQAFLQISMDEEDRDFLRFLWWEDAENKKIKVMRHRRVVFGVNCSPFLLGAVIQHHLDQCKPPFEGVAEQLKDSFYVDNCITSVDCEEELERFVNQATEIMAEAKFELRGWENTSLSEDERYDKQLSVLGLLWDKARDNLFCDVSKISKPQGSITRRYVLSVAQSVFDPIGFSCPVTLCPKLLLQESWKSKLSWDAELPEELCQKFLKWIEDLPDLMKIKIPRWISKEGTIACTLHTFCDASKSSYAAVVFLRSESDQTVLVQLLQAKSRIAPLKKITIPRMELMACLIGVRLATQVRKSLRMGIIREYYWTDSTTALHWITKDRQWGTFVKNRVKEIHDYSCTDDWRHVPGQDNPADLPSRGCTARVLVESQWWEGPRWLKLPERQWPKYDPVANEDLVNQEKGNLDVICVNASDHQEKWYLSYFSTYTKILRMVAWMLRFANNSRKRKLCCGELTACELDAAEKTVVKIIQWEAFNSDMKTIPKTLCVFEDRDGIIRLKTGLMGRQDEENFRLPMILPSKHNLTALIIQEQHLRSNHAGLHIVLTTLREKFWILKGRRTVRKVLSKCVRCRRHETKRIGGSPVTLPEDRVREANVFEVTGVDLAGPLLLKDCGKCWIILFTCAVFRAIHLELTTSLSTKSFLWGLRRFIARRGRPKVIYSDNGTNFVGAESNFRSIEWEKVTAEASAKRIQWKFNPPTAAWWGGWWERLIQIVKKLLRRTLGKASLNYEEMLTVLCDCEAIVNSRPLTYISEDSEDPIPLTPAMFLQSITEVGVPDLDHLDRVDLNKRFRYQQRLREELRKRFRSEYLSLLIQQHRGNRNEAKLVKVGDVVLLENEGKRRTFWPLARIIGVYPGKDNHCRVVKLKTAVGEMIRPIQRVFPLEITAPVQLEAPVQELAPQLITRCSTPRMELTTRSGRRVKLPLKLLQ